MDEQTLMDRLKAAAGSGEIELGATIRPAATADTIAQVGTEDTLAGPAVMAPRKLPHITVDVPGSLTGMPSPTDEADLQVRGLIGEGGMGRVFLARQHSLDRDVAVKTIRDSADGAIRQALVFEGVITGQLEHPAIVPVHALGLDQAGRPAMVMKRIEGVSWDELLANPAHEGWESWEGDADDRLPGHLQILSQVCNAVAFAHSREIVHRDLKPENVLIGRFGDIYVADWGIAARMGVEADQRLCGTPGYMAPEMVRGAEVDARTDVYLLGAVLHQILTGSLRHNAATGIAALGQALNSEPYAYDDEVPPSLATLANQACSADPAMRPESAMAFREALTHYTEHRQSMRLADEAMERFVALQTLEQNPQKPTYQREHDRLGAAARFGFEQALESWEDNPVAQEGLRELEALLEARRKRNAELEKIAHAHDPRVGARYRRIGLTLLAATGVLTGLVAWFQTEQPTALQLVTFGGGVGLGAVIMVYVLRKQLFKNEFGRNAVGMLMIGTGGMVLPRLVNLATPFDPAQALARDAFVLASVGAAAALALFPWLSAFSVCLAAGGIGCMVMPEYALQIFSAAIAVGFVISAILAWVLRPDRAPTEG